MEDQRFAYGQELFKDRKVQGFYRRNIRGAIQNIIAIRKRQKIGPILRAQVCARV